MVRKVVVVGLVVLGGADAYCCFWPDTADRCSQGCESVAPAGNWCAQSKYHCEVDCAPHKWCDESSSGGTSNSSTTPSSSSGGSTTTTSSDNVQTPGAVISGSFTTGYWDCCKPSCSWSGKGATDQNRAVNACGANGENPRETSDSEQSVCDGSPGVGSCNAYAPWVHNAEVTLGFAAVGKDSVPGIDGDETCSQCFELTWKSGSQRGPGAHPDIIGKRHVVQVINIGYDVSHSFDLQIPAAGQGIFDQGCARQYSGFSKGDFDCDNNYGGCGSISGCENLPDFLKEGCYWRYAKRASDDSYIYGWRVEDNKSDNPMADFRRVKCPSLLTDISGAWPENDPNYPEVDLGAPNEDATGPSAALTSSSSSGGSVTTPQPVASPRPSRSHTRSPSRSPTARPIAAAPAGGCANSLDLSSLKMTNMTSWGSKTNVWSLQQSGCALSIADKTWKAFELPSPVVVSATTKLDFCFTQQKQCNVHAIGVTTSNTNMNKGPIFQVSGWSNWNNANNVLDYNDYNAGTGEKCYSIDLASHLSNYGTTPIKYVSFFGICWNDKHYGNNDALWSKIRVSA